MSRVRELNSLYSPRLACTSSTFGQPIGLNCLHTARATDDAKQIRLVTVDRFDRCR